MYLQTISYLALWSPSSVFYVHTLFLVLWFWIGSNTSISIMGSKEVRDYARSMQIKFRLYSNSCIFQTTGQLFLLIARINNFECAQLVWESQLCDWPHQPKIQTIWTFYQCLQHETRHPRNNRVTHSLFLLHEKLIYVIHVWMQFKCIYCSKLQQNKS